MIAMEISDLVQMMNEGVQRRITQLTEEQEQRTVGDLELLLIAVCVLSRWIIRETTDYYAIFESVAFLTRQLESVYACAPPDARR
jgi:hypothetical protein